VTTPQQYPPPGHYFPASSPTNPQPIQEGPGGMIPPGKRSAGKTPRFGWRGVIIAALIGFVIGLAFGQVQGQVPTTTTTTTQSTGFHSAEPTEEPATEAPATQAPEPKAEPKVTRAQAEALESAESYLDSGHFSKQGLTDQLTSEYGEDFDKKDALWAIAHVDADYKAEAVEAAESYLDSGHFSKRELTNQLTSKYGEGFTKAEAAYAVGKVY